MAHQSQTKKVAILGCGWLGLPLATSFILKNYDVNGSTTTIAKLETLKNNAINPYLINLGQVSNEAIADFFEVDILIICIAPGKSSPEDQYVQHLANILPFISPASLVISISSTSVYHAQNTEVFENDVVNWTQSASKKIAKAEDLIRDNIHKFIILRCAGLTGYDRMLAKHFSGKTDLKEGNCPVNLIHRDDVIEIIHFVINNGIENEVINICAPNHPTKSAFYSGLCNRFGLATPTFILDDTSSFKIVNVNKLVHILGYVFKYDDPYTFDYQTYVT